VNSRNEYYPKGSEM